MHTRGGVSRVRISLFADDEIDSWRWRRVCACELFSRCELDSDVRRHRPVPLINGSRPTAGNPKLTGDAALDVVACNYEKHLVTRAMI